MYFPSSRLAKAPCPWFCWATSVGFMSTSDKRVHFVLGKQTAIKEVEIQWPRGAVMRLTNVRADHFLKVEEPAQ
ncbi:MAG: ASPIC/UnbV domain-containing protein [Terriglobia bacterium]